MKRMRKRFSAAGAYAMAAATALVLSGTANSLIRIACAQSAQPQPQVTVEPVRGEIQRDGWSLKPAGVDLSQWPAAKFNFSIERTDRTPFNGLDASAIEVWLDNSPLIAGSDALKSESRNPVSVLLMIDASRSMDGAFNGTSKLEAATRALISMVERLDQHAMIAVIAFDKAQRVVSAPTRDKSALRSAIHGFLTTGGGTRLYDAGDFALRYAEAHELRNIILLSDGCDYTPETRALMNSPAQYERYKRERETRIVEQSRRTGIRLFTIAIGDKSIGTTEGLYVDTVSLQHMAQGSAGGFSEYIDLPRLQRAAENDRVKYQRLLAANLEAILTRISESFRYNYSLRLPLGAGISADDARHILKLSFTAGNHKLPVEIPFIWRRGAALPAVEQLRVLAPILIRAPKESVSSKSLLSIYLFLTLLLAVLAALPSMYQQAHRIALQFKHRKAVFSLRKGSALIGRSCPNEQSRERGKYLFQTGDTVVICPQCAVAHHLNCWQLNQDRCWSHHCGYEMPLESNDSAGEIRRAA